MPSSARPLLDHATIPKPRSRARRRTWIVCLAAAAAIVALWAVAWAPQLSRADAEVDPSEVATALDEAQRKKGSASHQGSDTSARGAQLGLVTMRIVQLTAEKARLEAERDGAAEVHFPPGFVTSNRGAAAAVARERRLFETRRAVIDRQRALLGRRIAQVRHEVDGLIMQQRAKEKEVQLIREELQLIDDMHGRRLANLDRLMGLRRNLARSDGELGGLVAQIARARAQIEEIELQVVETEQKAVLEAHKEMRDIDARIDELSERRRGGEDQPAGLGLPQRDTRTPGKHTERPSAGGT
jgi:hypothetical protein